MAYHLQAIRSNTYVYEPVSPNVEIRVFELLPGRFEDPIWGHLVREPFDNGYQPRYDALSYVWGDSSIREEISVNGCRFIITKALELALRHLRSTDSVQCLWIDALCINQDDLQERSHQVPMMASIYGRALTVRIWLGPSSEHSTEGMRFLKCFLHDSGQQDTEIWHKLYPPQIFHTGIQDVVGRLWFQRIWVQQEAALAATALMQCGDDQFVWHAESSHQVRKHIKRIKFAEISPQWDQAGLRGMDMAPVLNILDHQYQRCLNLEGKPRPRPDLLDLMHVSRSKLATDPRDKIYALAGLAGATGLVVDYSLNVHETYERLKHLFGIDEEPALTRELLQNIEQNR